jgi:hypothetical protein
MARRVAVFVTGLTVLAAIWAGVAPTTAEARAQPPSSPAPDSSTVLAVVNGAHGTLRLRGGSGGLTLTGVSARPVWFSDRPQRAAGTYSMQQFIDAFFRQQQPPNAALEVSGTKGAPDVVILELSKPRYTRSSDTLHFDSKLVPDPTRTLGPSSQLRWESTRIGAHAPTSFGTSSLFVDAAAGDSTAPCQVPAQNGYIPTLNSISCPDAALLASMTDIANTCETNPQYYELPIFGIWICNGTPSAGVSWNAGSENFRFYDASFTMYPCSQNPPACNGQS